MYALIHLPSGNSILLPPLFQTAPEVIRGDGYGKCSDWWSLGNLIYELTTGWVSGACTACELNEHFPSAPVPFSRYQSPPTKCDAWPTLAREIVVSVTRPHFFTAICTMSLLSLTRNCASRNEGY